MRHLRRVETLSIRDLRYLLSLSMFNIDTQLIINFWERPEILSLKLYRLCINTNFYEYRFTWLKVYSEHTSARIKRNYLQIMFYLRTLKNRIKIVLIVYNNTYNNYSFALSKKKNSFAKLLILLSLNEYENVICFVLLHIFNNLHYHFEV